jgi:hypothetical protein
MFECAGHMTAINEQGLILYAADACYASSNAGGIS